MPVIQVRDLTKTFFNPKRAPGFGGAVRGLFSRERTAVTAVDAVSFDIEQGELVGFLGPNGAGKTTTLKMLTGIVYPTSGQATVLGYTPWERKKPFQKQISLVMGQKNQLWWDLPASESFLLLREIYEVPDDRYRKTLGDLVELLAVKDVLSTQVRKLSLGERMKLELIAALLHSPRVLFLDEPTIGLDVVSQKRIREFVKDYNRSQQTTIILTSHYMDDIQELCERVVIIDHGRMVFNDRLAELVSRYSHTRLLKLAFSAPIERADAERFGNLVEFDGISLTLEVPREESVRVAASVLAALPVADITIEEMGAEEVIRNLFQRNADARAAKEAA
ncbi:MAG TPA: ATP-binding cassette domain-containing protein [Armatimonadota bacterium]|jgi:ABC-2 type transport system ATP-binding protein